MTDLGDIATLAFADEGVDCLVVAALASLLVGKRANAVWITLAAFLACWAYPLFALASQYDRGVAVEAATHALAALPTDAVWLAARFGGMLLVVTGLWRARLALHGRGAVAEIEARAA